MNTPALHRGRIISPTQKLNITMMKSRMHGTPSDNVIAGQGADDMLVGRRKERFQMARRADMKIGYGVDPGIRFGGYQDSSLPPPPKPYYVDYGRAANPVTPPMYFNYTPTITPSGPIIRVPMEYASSSNSSKYVPQAIDEHVINPGELPPPKPTLSLGGGGRRRHH